MPNQYVNKVTVNNATIIDLTADTVTAATLMQGYTAHDASGAPITGTASGGGATLTTVVPQQTFTAQELSGSYQTTVTYTAGLEDGEAYVVTFDGEQYICECGVYWGTEYMAGTIDFFWNSGASGIYPFGLDYSPSGNELSVGVGDTSQHIIKVEHLEFVDEPLNLIAKSVTENGTYTASSDNADGYSSVTVDVPSGGGSVSLTYAGFYGVTNGTIYYTDENMQQQSGTSLAANLPSGSIVAVTATNTSMTILFEPGQDMSESFGLTSLKTLTVSRKTYARVFVVN